MLQKYISEFGQVWHDVVISRLVNDADLTSLIEQIPDLDNYHYRGSIYQASFCTHALCVNPVLCNQVEDLSVGKCVGANAPKFRWLKHQFPELGRLKGRLIFRRLERMHGSSFLSGLRDAFHSADTIKRHSELGEGKHCVLRCTPPSVFPPANPQSAAQSPPRNPDGVCTNTDPHTEVVLSGGLPGNDAPLISEGLHVYIRIHLRAPSYAYSLDSFPDFSALRERGCSSPRAPGYLIPVCDREGCHLLGMVCKPVGLPCQPHVSNLVDCLSGQMEERLTLNKLHGGEPDDGELDGGESDGGAGGMIIRLGPRDSACNLQLVTHTSPASPPPSSAMPCRARQQHPDFLVHPLHRLDRCVGGLVACRLKRNTGDTGVAPGERTAGRCRLKGVRLRNKTYRALACVGRLKRPDGLPVETLEDLEGFLEGHASRVETRECPPPENGDVANFFTFRSYTPAGNMFDRTTPVLMSPTARKGWKECETTVRVLGMAGVLDTKTSLATFEVVLGTGRRHQIRALFAAMGMALYGDAEYASIAGFAVPDEAGLLACENFHRRLRTIWYDKLAAALSSAGGQGQGLENLTCDFWDEGALRNAPELLRRMAKAERSSSIGLWAEKLAVEVDTEDADEGTEGEGNESRDPTITREPRRKRKTQQKISVTYEASESSIPWWDGMITKLRTQ